MKLINNSSYVEYVAEGNETADQLAFLEKIKLYKLYLSDATVLVYDQNDNLMLCINSFDNTILVCSKDGYQLAADFGAKRFPISEAKKQFDSTAIHFARDLAFPVLRQGDKVASNYCVTDLFDGFKQFGNDRLAFYQAIAELYNRCADFLPSKQDEYLKGGSLADKYCRFNQIISANGASVIARQTLLFENKRIVGAINSVAVRDMDGGYDIYLFDEVVDYFTLLSDHEKKQLDVLTSISADLSAKIANSNVGIESVLNEAKAVVDKAISEIVEPKRTLLLGELFAAVRMRLPIFIPDLHAKAEQGLVRAVIRATSARKVPGHDAAENFKKLGCMEDPSIMVIHGRPTAHLTMLDDHIKQWASARIQSLRASVVDVSVFSTSRTITTPTIEANLNP